MNWIVGWLNGWFLRGLVENTSTKSTPEDREAALNDMINNGIVKDGRPRTLNIEGFLQGNKGEKFTAQEIAERMGLSVAEVTGSINKLVVNKVVCREPIKGDDGIIHNYISYI